MNVEKQNEWRYRFYKIRRIFRIFHWLFSVMAKMSRNCAKHVHILLHYVSLLELNEQHSYYDHNIDLYTWTGERGGYPAEPHWLERGVYNLLAIKYFDEPLLIELCCGDGFNTKYFYSTSCKHIYACDFDKDAIHYAEKNNKCPNIQYEIADINKYIPEKVMGKNPTNIVWDGSMIYFNDCEIKQIMNHMKRILAYKKGILSGMVSAGPHKGRTIRNSFDRNKGRVSNPVNMCMLWNYFRMFINKVSQDILAVKFIN